MENADRGRVKKTGRRDRVILIVLGLIFIAIVALTLVTPVHRWGDASTYYMQMLSIVNDHDVQYTAQDLLQIQAHPFEDTPSGLFLVKTPAGLYFYGKDFSYALFAAPFFALIGNSGILLFNGLMFFAMIAMGYLYLKKANGRLSVLYAGLFFVLSTYFIYVFWVHADIYNTFLIMLGLFLWLIYAERGDRRILVASSLALGLAMVAKAPNAVIFVPLALFEIYKKRYSDLLIACGAFLVPVLLFTGYYYLQTGSLSYYGGDRYSYVGRYPFMDGFNATNEAGNMAFSVASSDRMAVNLNMDDPVIIPYNLLYYFFGRFTGALWYFPFAAFALVSFLWDLRKPAQVDRLPEKLCILAAIALYILLFITVIGDNYAGNQTGDRYFYVYPAFIFLLGKVDIKKATVFLILALITVGPMVVDPVATSISPGSHVEDFPYPYFPLEYSQLQQLPMMATGYPYQGHTLIVYGDRPAYTGGVFIIDKPVKMTILSPVPVGQIKLLLVPGYNSTAVVDLDGVKKEADVDTSRNSVAVLTDIKPAYSDTRYSIYELSVDIKSAQSLV